MASVKLVSGRGGQYVPRAVAVAVAQACELKTTEINMHAGLPYRAQNI
jgi:hypothetical protein